MDETTPDLRQLATSTRRLAQRLLTIGENRLVLLALEMQEERERLLHVVLIALGMAVFALLSGMTLTATVVVMFWEQAPIAVLIGLTVLYGLIAFLLCRRVMVLLRDWHTFPDSLDQLRKDRVSLDAALT